MIGLVDAHGGEVVRFAGDALLAVWVGDAPDASRRAAACALAVQASLGAYSWRDVVPLTLRIAVAAGPLQALFVMGRSDRWECVLTGAPVHELAVAEHQAQPGEVMLAPSAYGALGGNAQAEAKV